MNATRVMDMARRMSESVLDYGPDQSRLLVRVMRTLALGEPVEARQVERIIADLKIPQDEAHQFLRRITERDAADRIVGILGLSLNQHPHRFAVNGVTMSAWCAEDTLFLPAVLKQSATVESVSPLRKQKIQLTIGPDRVETVSPREAVVSIVVLNPADEHVASVEVIWNTFCEHILFFASRQEAEQWATGRDDIEIVDVATGFELGRQLTARVLAYAD